METSAPAQSASDRYPRAASPIHMILVLAAMGGWAIGHKIFVYQLSATANPNRVRYYVVTIFYEWLLFVLVVAGVRRSGASVLIVLGEPALSRCRKPPAFNLKKTRIGPPARMIHANKSRPF